MYFVYSIGYGNGMYNCILGILLLGIEYLFIILYV